MSKSKNVTIPIERYIELLKDSETLRLLENGGVDNWDWYGESLNPDDKHYSDIMEQIEKNVKENHSEDN